MDNTYSVYGVVILEQERVNRFEWSNKLGRAVHRVQTAGTPSTNYPGPALERITELKTGLAKGPLSAICIVVHNYDFYIWF